MSCLILERQDHLSWPLLTDALRETRQRLHDAQWHGEPTDKLATDVAYLRGEIDNGATRVPNF